VGNDFVFLQVAGHFALHWDLPSDIMVFAIPSIQDLFHGEMELDGLLCTGSASTTLTENIKSRE